MYRQKTHFAQSKVYQLVTFPFRLSIVYICSHEYIRMYCNICHVKVLRFAVPEDLIKFPIFPVSQHPLGLILGCRSSCESLDL